MTIPEETIIMLKIDNKISCHLTMALSVLFFAGLIVCGVGLVPYLNTVSDTLEAGEKPVVIGIGYAVLVLAAAADALLFALLRRVQKEAVFTAESVALLRGISWCCVAAGALFVWLGCYFLLAYAVAFVAVLVGICLRVVKNVIAEATEIKSENDLTV